MFVMLSERLAGLINPLTIGIEYGDSEVKESFLEPRNLENPFLKSVQFAKHPQKSSEELIVAWKQVPRV